MANKKRIRELVPTHKWSVDYLEDLLNKQLTEVDWDRNIMDKILYHFPNEYLKFQCRWEQLNRRK